MAMVNIDDMNNYKPVKKTVYDIHVCKPPTGTIVINKLEQADVVKKLHREYFTVADLQIMQQKNPAMYNTIRQLKAAGRVYEVGDSDVVLAGTCGEMWTVKLDKLVKTYTFLQDGQRVAITPQILKRRCLFNGYLPWTLARTKADAGVVFACFVPNSQKGTIPTPWGVVLNYNDPNAKHGKGDFIIAQNANGQPNMGDRYVVNGEIFARTYTSVNRGAFDGCLVDVPKNQTVTIDQLPVLVTTLIGEGECENPELFAFVENLLTKMQQLQSRSLPMKFERNNSNQNQILLSVKASNIVRDSRSRDDFVSEYINTVITITRGNVLEFRIRSQGSQGNVRSKLDYLYTVPFGAALSQTVDGNEVKSWLSNNYDIAFGLCGFVREVGVHSSVTFSPMTDKFMVDSLRDYVLRPDEINALCRGYSDAKGERLVGTVRTIEGCDEAFTRARTTRPLRVFRGQVLKKSSPLYPKDFNNPLGLVVNTSYTSATLNMAAASYFAANTKNNSGQQVGDQQGIIHVIDVPPETSAIYMHGMAEWVDQCEFAFDRIYDLNVEEVLFEFRDNLHNKYKVVRSRLVQHQPGESLDKVQSAKLIEKLIADGEDPEYYFDSRVFLTKTLSMSLYQETVDILKRRGFSNVQFNDGTLVVNSVDEDGKIIYKDNKAMKQFMSLDDYYKTRDGKDYGLAEWAMEPGIIVRTKNADSGRYSDYFFTTSDYSYVAKGGFDVVNGFVVRKVVVPQAATGDFGDNSRDRVLSDYGLSSYVLGKQSDIDEKIRNESDADKRSELMGIKEQQSNDILNSLQQFTDKDTVVADFVEFKNSRPEEMADAIVRYLKKNDNMSLLPLAEVARYFSFTFSQVIVREGYELKHTIPVERVVDKNKEADPQAGYARCRFTITGDDDDNLVIMVRFFRDMGTKKLVFEYRGRSNNTAVKDEKTLRFDSLTEDNMMHICENILKVFVSKMHLSKTRRIDSLLAYYARKTGCTVVPHDIRYRDKDAYAGAKTLVGDKFDGDGYLDNYHHATEIYKANSYNVWSRSHKSKMLVVAARENVDMFNLYIKRDGTELGTLQIDGRKPIYELYYELVKFLISKQQLA